MAVDNILQIIVDLQIHELIFKVFLPFIITFAIFWGVLEAAGKFNRRINMVLALSITLAAGYGGLFSILSNYFLNYGALFGITAFFAVFVIGVIAWAAGRGRDIIYENLSSDKRVENISKKLEKEYERFRRENNPAKKRAIDRKITELEREREHVLRDRRF